MATYKTKDGTDRTIPGIGRTVNGQISTDAKIESPLFELVSDTAPVTPPQPAAPAAAPITQTPVNTTAETSTQEPIKEKQA